MSTALAMISNTVDAVESSRGLLQEIFGDFQEEGGEARDRAAKALSYSAVIA